MALNASYDTTAKIDLFQLVLYFIWIHYYISSLYYLVILHLIFVFTHTGLSHLSLFLSFTTSYKDSSIFSKDAQIKIVFTAAGKLHVEKACCYDDVASRNQCGNVEKTRWCRDLKSVW